jgi:hypothetical protein
MDEYPKLKDLREDDDIPIGNIIETLGDSSMGYFTTDKGYRLILDAHNMMIIEKYFREKNKSK